MQAEAALRELGVSEAQIAAQRVHRAPMAAPAFALWAWHQVPFKVFAAMRRQWRVRGPMVMGLDLAVLPVVEQRLGLPPLTAQQLQALDTLSEEAAEIMNTPPEGLHD